MGKWGMDESGHTGGQAGQREMGNGQVVSNGQMGDGGVRLNGGIGWIGHREIGRKWGMEGSGQTGEWDGQVTGRDRGMG